MAAFQFPENPQNGDTTTNAATGLTYIYRNPPGKWEVLMTTSASDFVNVTGDTMTGPLVMDPDSATSTGVVNIKVSTTAADNFGLKIRDSSDNPFFQAGGDKGVEYFGPYTESVHLATKANVDSAVASFTSLIDESSLIHGGTIAEGSEGSVSSTGNLSIQLSSNNAGGELYIRSAPNVDVIALKQTGTIQIYGEQSITALGASNNSVKLYGW